MDENDMMAATDAGDDGALRELFNRHALWLAIRLRRVLPVEAVEDALEDTRIVALQGAASYTVYWFLRRLALGDCSSAGGSVCVDPLTLRGLTRCSGTPVGRLSCSHGNTACGPAASG